MMALAALMVYVPEVRGCDPDGKFFLYAKMRKVLYMCLKSALLLYRKIWKNFHRQGFM